MPTVLGGLAEFERDLIRARTSEGRDGDPVRKIARSYNISHSTISRLSVSGAPYG
jgi:DNA invertase Pin-like site-specific DNA recombinase